MKPKLYGVYSVKQRQLMGACLYSTPAGGTLLITAAGPSRNAGSSWDDTQLLGEVSEFIRRVEPMSMPIQFIVLI